MKDWVQRAGVKDQGMGSAAKGGGVRTEKPQWTEAAQSSMAGCIFLPDADW